MLRKGKSMANEDYNQMDLRNPLEDLESMPKHEWQMSAEVCEKLDAATVNDLLHSTKFDRGYMRKKVKKILKKTMTFETSEANN